MFSFRADGRTYHYSELGDVLAEATRYVVVSASASLAGDRVEVDVIEEGNPLALYTVAATAGAGLRPALTVVNRGGR